MRTYYVQTYVYHPYKIEAVQTIKASSISLAIKRAVDVFRKTEKLRGRRIEQVWATARPV
jgi:hypothetical protein